ncbi:MAG: aminopeptidase [Rhizobacter sp.]|nr:aminopeptidase [Chlorobiales bacterium]
MKRTWILPTLFLLFAHTTLIAQTAMPNKMAGVDIKALAERIVTQSAAVKEGEIVQITGSVRDAELLDEIALNVYKVGGHAFVRLSSEMRSWRSFNEVPAKYDSQEPKLGLKLAEIIDVLINVSVGENLNLFAGADPVRLAAQEKASAGLIPIYIKRKVRRVDVGNDLYPTANLAKRWGVSESDLASLFWKGVSADYTRIAATGESVKARLAGGKELVLTHPNGTNLKMRIEQRPVVVSDGLISEADKQAGAAASIVYLPAGEVMVTPVPGTAEGTVVIDRQFYEGKEIGAMTLTFKAGKMTSMTSKSDITRLKAFYDAAGARKDEFAVIDIGINSEIGLIAGSKMESWIPAGMITVGFGGNDWAGGDNPATFVWGGHQSGCTLKVDGQTLVENGTLKP